MDFKHDVQTMMSAIVAAEQAIEALRDRCEVVVDVDSLRKHHADLLMESEDAIEAIQRMVTLIQEDR